MTLYIQNDKSGSWGTGDQIAHICRDSNRTLCGIWWKRRGWFTKPTEQLGGATLCGRCERIAGGETWDAR